MSGLVRSAQQLEGREVEPRPDGASHEREGSERAGHLCVLRRNDGDRGRISAQRAPVALVVPTDEELLIARDTARLVATVATSARVHE